MLFIMFLPPSLAALAQMRGGQHTGQCRKQHRDGQNRGHDDGFNAECIRRHTDMLLAFRSFDPLAAHQGGAC